LKIILKYRVSLIILILGLFFVKPGIALVAEAPEVHFILQWGKIGTARGEFNQPIGISVDSDGNVYVSDSGNNRMSSPRI